MAQRCFTAAHTVVCSKVCVTSYLGVHILVDGNFCMTPAPTVFFRNYKEHMVLYCVFVCVETFADVASRQVFVAPQSARFS